MSNEKYKFTVSLVSLILASLSFVFALFCMINLILAGGSVLASILILPLLIICLFVVAATSLFAFINMATRLGKIAFLISIVSMIFILVSFILLFN